MDNPKTVTDILGLLVLCGLMGMVGQGARTVVGLKKVSDSVTDTPSQADDFQASRIVVGLMIGFIAGVIAGLSLNILQAKTLDISTLMGLAAAGYAGTDFIEGFTATIGSMPTPKWKPPAERESPSRAAPANPNTSVTTDTQSSKPAGRLFGLEQEYRTATQYQALIAASASRHRLNLDVVYAVGSRESAWGLTLRPKGASGTGDWAPRDGHMPPDGLGWGRGLMQADYAASEFAKTGTWQDPAANIEFGCNELGDNIAFYTSANLPNIDPLRAGIAAYNCGRGNVHKAISEGKDVDYYTTGHDYSSDVSKRAAWFKERLAQNASA